MPRGRAGASYSKGRASSGRGGGRGSGGYGGRGRGSWNPTRGRLSRGGRDNDGTRATRMRSGVMTKAQPFDYFLVVDFECTCEVGDDTWPHEIIEFPVVVLDAESLEIAAEFHSYVRPVKNTTLTAFCTDLTGITQAQVDAAPTLPEVLVSFKAWFAETFDDDAQVMVATDGPTDMEDFMFRRAVRQFGVEFPELFYKYIDVKKTFHLYFKPSKRCKLSRMLTEMGLKFEGSAHSGIDDSRNIARLMVSMIKKGCVFGHPIDIRGRCMRRNERQEEADRLADELYDDDGAAEDGAAPKPARAHGSPLASAAALQKLSSRKSRAATVTQSLRERAAWRQKVLTGLVVVSGLAMSAAYFMLAE